MSRRRVWLLGAGAAALALGVALVAGRAYLLRAPKLDTAPLENYYRALRPPVAQAVDLSALRAAISAASGHLKRANLESGQFVYAVNLDPAVPVEPGYNLLRHAGAIYALGMSHAVMPDPEAVRVMTRAADFMRVCCMTKFEDDDMLAVWEPPQLTGGDGPAQYKLGGAALGLAALVSLADASPGSVPEGDMQGLARFGRFMMRWDGEFYSMYVPSGDGRTLRGVSLFYPGEMALAWLMLHERHPSAEWVESAVAALSYLARERAIARNAPIDHWALLATARLFQIAERDGLSIPRQALFDHALQVCHAIVEGSHAPARIPAMEGSLVKSGQGAVPSTAAALEGLLAALTFLPPSHPITPHVAAAAHRGIDYLMQAQIKEGPHAGGMPSDVSTVADDGSEAARKFNAQSTEVRIDYVQHALSAMVQYLGWSTSPPAGRTMK
jgi:hypothetical protein